MKNGKSSNAAVDLFYDDDEKWTPHERKFLAGMGRKKREMEDFILNLAAHRFASGRVYRKRIVQPEEFQPAYDFLLELRQLIAAHVCKDDTPLCWARELSKMCEEYANFLAIQEIIIFYSSRFSRK